MNLLKIEFFKLMHRKEFMIILYSSLLSLVLAVTLSVAPESYKVDYPFGGEGFPLSCYMVLGYAFFALLGVFQVMFAVLTTSLSSVEIDTHYFYLYFPRATDRKMIYRSKVISVTIFAVVWYIVYTLVLNSMSYLYLKSVRPDVATGLFSDGSLLYWSLMWAVYLLDLILYINLGLALGMYLKPLTNIVVILAVFYGASFFYAIPFVKYLLPEYYKQGLAAADDLSQPQQLIRFFVGYVLVCAAYMVVLNIVGLKRIKKLDCA